MNQQQRGYMPYQPTNQGTIDKTSQAVNPTSTGSYNNSLTPNNGVGTNSQMAEDQRMIESSPNYVMHAINRTQNVMKEMQSRGEDTSVQQAYMNKLMGQMSKFETDLYNPGRDKETMSNFFGGMAESNYNQQLAQLEYAKNQALADLDKALADAVAQGELSMREAELAYAEQKDSIEAQAYQDAEATKAYATGRGIQDSNQMIALQQGDDARKNSNLNNSMRDRDKRKADVKTRITNLKTQTAYDKVKVNSTFDFGKANAMATANQNYMQNMGQYMMNDIQSNKAQHYAQLNQQQEQEFKKEMFELESDQRFKEMEKQMENQIKIMYEQQGLDKEMASYQSQLRMKEISHQASQSARYSKSSGGSAKNSYADGLQQGVAQILYGNSALATDKDGKPLNPKPVAPNRDDYNKWYKPGFLEDKAYNKDYGKYQQDYNNWNQSNKDLFDFVANPGKGTQNYLDKITK